MVLCGFYRRKYQMRKPRKSECKKACTMQVGTTKLHRGYKSIRPPTENPTYIPSWLCKLNVTTPKAPPSVSVALKFGTVSPCVLTNGLPLVRDSNLEDRCTRNAGGKPIINWHLVGSDFLFWLHSAYFNRIRSSFRGKLITGAIWLTGSTRTV